MADIGGQEKTEAPTGRRIQHAREEGNVARSQEFNAAVVLLAGLVGLYFLGGRLAFQMAMSARRLFHFWHVGLSNAEIIEYSQTTLLETLYILAPILGVLAIVAILVNLGQVGFIFTTKPLELNFNVFDLSGGFDRLLSRRNGVRFLVSLAKLAVVSAVAFWSLKGQWAKLETLFAQDAQVILAVTGKVIYDVCLRIVIAMLILGIIDLIYQRWEYMQDLRMSKQEVQEELRQMEGDPKIRLKRRQIQLKVAMQRMMQAVPKADVVITNPTHLSVAIQYDAASMAAPKVVAKGADDTALRIREIAQMHGIPVVERRNLARSIYSAVEVGHFIPEKLYHAVAEVLAFVYRVNDKGAKLKPKAVYV